MSNKICSYGTTVCLKKITKYNKKSCSYAINKLQDIKNRDRHKKEFSCSWFINDDKSHYCFWEFIDIADNQKEYSIEDIAKLTCCTSFNIYLARGTAIKKLKLVLAKNPTILSILQHKDEA